jgi:hypothetical protein
LGEGSAENLNTNSNKGKETAMLQLIGLLIILNSLVVAGWWLTQQKSGMAACISLQWKTTVRPM